MALLTRYFQLNDAGDTQVFNFIVTKSVTRDFSRNVKSKDFSYRWHRWAMSFSREDKTLGAYLLWQSPSDGLHVTLDFTVTLLNREDFAENRSFTIKRATFSSGYHSNGNGTFIKIADLLTHRPRYVDLNGEFQVELKLSNVDTYFEKDLFFTRNIVAALKGQDPDAIKSHIQDDPGINVQLQRKFRPQSQALLCRLCYTFSAGIGDKKHKSDPRDEMIGTQEATQSWTPKGRLQDFYIRQIRDGGLVRIRVDLASAHVLSEFVMCPSPPQQQSDEDSVDFSPFGSNGHGSSAASAPPPGSPTVLGVDQDGANWALESDTHSSFIRFSLVYLDINKIPRNHLRFVQWRSFLVRRSKRWRGHRDEKEVLELVDFQSGNLFSRYYTQDESDQGVMMETTLSTKEIKEGINEFLEDGNLLRVRIQWEYSHQLFQATVHQYDDIVRHHNLQMRAEIEHLKEKIRRLELNQMKQEVEHKQIQQQQQQHLLRTGDSTESSNGSLASNDVDLGAEGVSLSPGSGLHMRPACHQLSLPLQLNESGGLASKRKVSPLTLTSSSSIGGVGHPMSRSPSPRPPGHNLQARRMMRRGHTLQHQNSTTTYTGFIGEITAKSSANNSNNTSAHSSLDKRDSDIEADIVVSVCSTPPVTGPEGQHGTLSTSAAGTPGGATLAAGSTAAAGGEKPGKKQSIKYTAVRPVHSR